jgi:hypothetical protein
MTLAKERLSDAEIHVLDVFLLSDSTPEEGLSVDELHGYLTAIVCCPVPVMPSDWLIRYLADGGGAAIRALRAGAGDPVADHAHAQRHRRCARRR